jgi:hypothetical protein
MVYKSYMDHKKYLSPRYQLVTGSVYQRAEQEGQKIPGMGVAILTSADRVMLESR